MTQTKWESLTEVLIGTTFNVVLALVFNVTLLPLLIGVPIGFLLGAKVTALYTGISLLVRYYLRRYYNAKVRHQMRDMRSGRGSIQSIQGRVSMPSLPEPDYHVNAHPPRGYDRGGVGPTQSTARKRPDKVVRERQKEGG